MQRACRLDSPPTATPWCCFVGWLLQVVFLFSVCVLLVNRSIFCLIQKYSHFEGAPFARRRRRR